MVSDYDEEYDEPEEETEEELVEDYEVETDYFGRDERPAEIAPEEKPLGAVLYEENKRWMEDMTNSSIETVKRFW